MLKNIVCPVSSQKVDSNKSRITVFINVILMVTFLFVLQPILLYIVAIDYGIRAMGYNKYSILGFFASFIVKIIGIKPKMINKAPKVFASRLGLVCAVLGIIFILLNYTTASIIIIGLFTVLAVMDSVFNFCLGCLIYHNLVYPFFKE